MLLVGFIISYSGDKMKEDELGGACDMYGVKEKFIQGFSDQP